MHHNTSQHILLLEPYYGGSHKAFLIGLQQQLNGYHFTLLSLPARKWKMRMQLAAPWFAERIVEMIAQNNNQGKNFDGILTSTFLDVAVLRSLLAAQGIYLPLAIYFHENQFSYPGQTHDPGMLQFASINFNSALCADRLAFNSCYNLETFLDGICFYLKKSADMELCHLEEQIRKKSVILYPGIDFRQIDVQSEGIPAGEGKNNEPVIVWNHRWEHDKDPETFFLTLFELALEYPFQVIVLGQHFHHQPEIFAQAKSVLGNRLIHFGYVESRKEYARLLRQGDFIVSTARHEFFGISVLEGIRAGCRPVVPDRLSYRELFPKEYRYSQGKLGEHLHSLFASPRPVTNGEVRRLTEPYSWLMLGERYQKWLQFTEMTIS
ncbi:Glycosyltransferase involved in cell wall bisynthesis [Candidatus Electrothrix aarhusensis]|jgi:glycosyltransferase involved in cell wall biosynthesis